MKIGGIFLLFVVGIATTLLNSPQAWAQKSSKTKGPTVVKAGAGKTGNAKSTKSPANSNLGTANPWLALYQLPTHCSHSASLSQAQVKFPWHPLLLQALVKMPWAGGLAPGMAIF